MQAIQKARSFMLAARAEPIGEEEWKSIPEHDLYEVSSLGRVRTWIPLSLNAEPTPFPRHIATSVKRSTGYAVISIQKDGRQKEVAVHRAVLVAFSGPSNGLMCRHLDGCRTNNRIDNLRWGTAAENARDSMDHGTLRVGEMQSGARITSAQAAEIRRSELSTKELSERFSLNQTTVRRIRKGKAWKHVA